MATNYNHIAYSKSADGREGFTTLYPNLNLEQHTEMLVDASDTLLYGGKGGATATMTHENVSLIGLPAITDAVHVTQTSQGQSGWRSPSGSFGVEGGTTYTVSAHIKNMGTETISLGLYLGVSAQASGASPKYLTTFQDVTPSTDFVLYTQTIEVPVGYSYGWSYVYTGPATTSSEWSFAGLKVEAGETQTPWMPRESEVTSQDYPTYIGTYTDENQNSSTNPEDYTWEMMNYRIYLDGIAVAGSQLLSAKVENLKPDTSYTIQVKQVSGEEESDFSDSVTFKTNVQK